MDARGVLDQLFRCGMEPPHAGMPMAERELGVAESGRQAATVTPSESDSIAGDLLTLMLGNGDGRRSASNVAQYDNLAAVATAACKACQSWQACTLQDDHGMSINDLDDQAAQGRGMLLIRSMIAAANADGHIDGEELKAIQGQLAAFDLNEETIAVLQSEFAQPLTPEQLSEHVDSTAAASEIYLLTLLLVDHDNETDRAYVSRLATCLRLPLGLATRLEERVGV